jgi:hypothetical protein
LARIDPVPDSVQSRHQLSGKTKIGNSDFIVGDRTGMNRLSFLS